MNNIIPALICMHLFLQMKMQSHVVSEACKIADQQNHILQCYLPEPRSINPLHISSHECTFGECAG